MGRLIAGAFLLSAIALAGMTGAFAQSNTSGGHTNSGTGIGKLHEPMPPPPPPPGRSGPHTDSGTGIGKLHALSAGSPVGFQSGMVVWVDRANHRFSLRHGGTHHAFQVRPRTVIRWGNHRVGFHALHRGQHARVAYHWSHHHRVADRVTIRRH